jgi:adenylate kinase family enzyme
MKVFILGLPESGQDQVAQALCQDSRYWYVDGGHWVRQTFRSIREDERPEQYQDAFHQYFVERLSWDADLCLRNIKDSMVSCNIVQQHFVIDGIATPRDFASLFDYSNDFVVFLNRTDSEEVLMKDYQKISVSVIRDYCFWMASADLLSRDRWFEYNFRMYGGDKDRFRTLGSKNSVFIVGSLDKAIVHLRETLESRQ